MPQSRRDTILNIIEDTVSRFLYYDRKEDEDLPRGAIDEAVQLGEITEAEIVAAFADHLHTHLKRRP